MITMASLQQQLTALNTRPATRVVLDADGREVCRDEWPNRAAANAAPLPEDGVVAIVGVYMLDLIEDD